MVKLHFLGRGAAFYPVFKNTNAFFEYGKDLYCLDFGETAFEQVAKHLPLAQYEHIYVLLTHLHADHSGSLASFASYLYCMIGKQLVVIHPEDTVDRLLALQGIAKHFYQRLPALPPEAGVSVRFIPVPHAVDIHAFGMRITCGEETFYYSGDAAELPQDVLADFLAGKVVHIYHDTASHPSESHCYYQKLVDAIPPEHRGDVSCMHLDCDMEKQLRSLGFDVVTCAFEDK